MNEFWAIMGRTAQHALLQSIWAGGVTVLIVALCGYASLRALRLMPGFPEKPALSRGARWGWAVLLDLGACSFAIKYAGLSSGLLFSLPCLARAFFWALLGILVYRCPLAAEGLLVGPVYWLWYRRRGPEIWLEDWRARRRQPRLRRAEAVCWALFVASWLVMAVGSHWFIELPARGVQADEALATALQTHLADARVTAVAAVSRGRSRSAPEVRVYVHRKTTPAQARQLVLRARQALAARGESRPWSVLVSARAGGLLAAGDYSPAGAAPSPGATATDRRSR